MNGHARTFALICAKDKFFGESVSYHCVEHGGEEDQCNEITGSSVASVDKRLSARA